MKEQIGCKKKPEEESFFLNEENRRNYNRYNKSEHHLEQNERK